MLRRHGDRRSRGEVPAACGGELEARRSSLVRCGRWRRSGGRWTRPGGWRGEGSAALLWPTLGGEPRIAWGGKLHPARGGGGSEP
jgi:hypothetical protein